MLIVCPSCASEYMIDPGRLGADGRTVRCASCKNTWFVTPEAEEPDAAADGEGPRSGTSDDAAGWSDASPSPPSGGRDGSEIGVTPRRKARRSGTEGSHGLTRGMRQFATGPLLALIGVLIIGSAFAGRAQVVRIFPATAALYASVGLGVNLRGLEFRAVRSELVGAGADTFLVVEGEIANISGRDTPVPPIEIGVRGAEGQMLYTWTNDPPLETLAVSDTAPFRARLAAPPADARQVLVRFATRQDGATVASHMPVHMHGVPGR